MEGIERAKTLGKAISVWLTIITVALLAMWGLFNFISTVDGWRQDRPEREEFEATVTRDYRGLEARVSVVEGEHEDLIGGLEALHYGVSELQCRARYRDGEVASVTICMRLRGFDP